MNKYYFFIVTQSGDVVLAGEHDTVESARKHRIRLNANGIILKGIE